MLREDKPMGDVRQCKRQLLPTENDVARWARNAVCKSRENLLVKTRPAIALGRHRASIASEGCCGQPEVADGGTKVTSNNDDFGYCAWQEAWPISAIAFDAEPNRLRLRLRLSRETFSPRGITSSRRREAGFLPSKIRPPLKIWWT